MGITAVLLAARLLLAGGAQTLSPQVARLDLAGGESRAAALDIEPNQYFRVSAVSPEIALSFAVYRGPDKLKDKLIEVSSLGGTGGIAEAVFETATPGDYRIEVKSLSHQPARRAVEIRLAPITNPQPSDREEADIYSQLLSAKTPEALENLLRRANALQRPQLAGRIALSLARAYGNGGRQAEGIATLARQLPSATDPLVATQMTYVTGLLYLFKEQTREAIPFFERALASQRAAHQPFEIALTVHNLATAHWLLDECAIALPQHEEARAIRQDLDDAPGAAYSLLAIAKDHYCLADFQEALDDYQSLVPAWRELKDTRNEAASLNDKGVIYAALGDWDQSRASHSASLKLRKDASDIAGQAESLNNLGQLALLTGENRQALGFYQEAFRLTPGQDHRRAQAYALMGIGEAQCKLETRGTIPDSLSQSARILHDLGERKGEGYALEVLAECQLARGDLNEAAAAFDQTLALERDGRDLPSQAVTLTAMAKLARANHNLPGARLRLDEAIQAIESNRSRVVDPNLRVSYLAAQRSAYELDAAVLSALNRVPAAFEAGERSHARSLLDRLNGTGDSEAKPASLQTIQSLLGPRDTLLEYLEGGEQSFLWAVTKSSLHAYELSSRGRIDPAIRTFYRALTARNQRPPGETAQARARRLSAADTRVSLYAARLRRLLLTPVLASLSGRKVIVVADGMLHFLPFSSLAPEIEFINAPSASVLATLRGHPTPSTGPVLVVADPVFSADDPRLDTPSPGFALRSAVRGFPRLPLSREEAQSIARLARNHPVTEALGFDAAAPLFNRPGIGDFQTIHIASHALLDTAVPERSGVVLSQFDRLGKPRNGFLPLSAIGRLQLHAGLVTLSACQTALGKNAAGEGLIGISRAFLAAGAKRVVGSLWSVEDGPTARFMNFFYEGVFTRGLAPSAALFAAQKAMRADARWSSPYYWAAFTLQGDWR